ncbi:MAG: DUF2269 family protein [Pseudomonadales bacterium]|nr:DUF2269 family protein [Pseudomonadales bacterium]
MTLKKCLKFLHTLGAVGMTGALAAYMLLLTITPPPSELSEYALMRQAMGVLCTWLLFPSLGIVILSGLIAIGVNRAFHDVGWVWAKLLLGISAFEGTLVAVQGPAQREAERATAALAGELDPALLAGSIDSEWGALMVIMAVALANIVLGVFRPRFMRRPTSSGPEREARDA